MKTTPKPPSPICSSSLYGPMTVPARSASGSYAPVRSTGSRRKLSGARALEKGFDFAAEFGIRPEGPVEEGRALVGGQLGGRVEELGL